MSIADDAERALRRGAEDAIAIAARLVLEEAKRNAPIGDPAEDPDPSVSLVDSGHLERDRGGWVVVFDAPYSAAQHENLGLRHPRGGQSKFLEHALITVVPTLDGVVASQVAKRLGRGLR